jgi:hypothetical protein
MQQELKSPVRVLGSNPHKRALTLEDNYRPQSQEGYNEPF